MGCLSNMRRKEKMSKFKVGFILCVLSFNPLFSNSDQVEEDSIFQDAVVLSESGKIEQALSIYSKLPESFSVSLNMASCHFALDDYARTLLYLKKAEKQASFEQRIHLLSRIEETYIKLGLVKEKKNRSFFENFKRTGSKILFMVHGLTPIWIFSLTLFFWFVLLILIKIRANAIFALFVLLMFVFSLGLMVEINKIITLEKAVVTQPNTKVYSGPSESFMLIGNAPLGTEIWIKKRTDQFVRAAFGWTQGWLKAENIAKI